MHYLDAEVRQCQFVRIHLAPNVHCREWLLVFLIILALVGFIFLLYALFFAKCKVEETTIQRGADVVAVLDGSGSVSSAGLQRCHYRSR